MKSKYNVGDIVTVKEQYDSGCNGVDYPCVFTKEMLQIYGSKKLTIEKVCYYNRHFTNYLTTEDYYYKVKETGYNWSDPMFQESEL